MSGLVDEQGRPSKPGGQPNLGLKQKGPFEYSRGSITSTRDVTFGGVAVGDRVDLTLGIRIKKRQTAVLALKKGGTDLKLRPAPKNVVSDLRKTLGKAADEKWVAYNFSWESTLGTTVESKLKLKNFSHTVPANGFQVVTVALCHSDVGFSKGPYSYGISVLPGKNSTGVQLLGGGG